MVRHLSGKLCESNDFSIVIMEGGNKNASPEDGTIFSETTPNVSCSPFFYGQVD